MTLVSSIKIMSGIIPKSNHKFIPQRFVQNVDRLYQNGLANTIFVSFLMAAIVSMILWQYTENRLVIYWFVSYTVFCSLRFVSYMLYQSRFSTTIQTASIWFLLICLGALVSGIFWGFMAIAINQTASLETNQLLTINCFFVIIIAALSAISAIVYNKNPGLMLSFSIPSVLSYALFLVLHSYPSLFLLGIMLIAYYGILLLVYTKLDKTIFQYLQSIIFKSFYKSKP